MQSVYSAGLSASKEFLRACLRTRLGDETPNFVCIVVASSVPFSSYPPAHFCIFFHIDAGNRVDFPKGQCSPEVTLLNPNATILPTSLWLAFAVEVLSAGICMHRSLGINLILKQLCKPSRGSSCYNTSNASSLSRDPVLIFFTAVIESSNSMCTFDTYKKPTQVICKPISV